MTHTQKIRDNYLFRRLYRRGKGEVSPCIVIYYQKIKGQKFNRLGITATKKIGKANRRNRARRVISESYRLLEGDLEVGYNFVIVARAPAAAVKMQTVRADMLKLFSKIGGIKPSLTIDSGRR